MRFDKLLTAIDAHTEGNPERVVVSGIPRIPGESMLEKARFVRDNMDYLRTLLVYEPRGHSNMYASLLVPPTDPRADFGVIFMENGGYPTMCGHGTISICTVIVESGYVEVKEPETSITLDTPAGMVHASIAVADGRAQSVTFTNVPSFLYRKDVVVKIPKYGEIPCDIAYGGNFYAILSAKDAGIPISPQNATQIIDAGMLIWEAVNEQVQVQHPENPEINFIDFVEFTGPPTHELASRKNAVFTPPSGIDRSPCGTGTCAGMAALHARGELALHESFVHESIISTLYYGELIEETRVGAYPAVIPTVRGSAYIMGIQQIVVDPHDPFPRGFILGKERKPF
jgi:proline racemase